MKELFLATMMLTAFSPPAMAEAVQYDPSDIAFNKYSIKNWRVWSADGDEVHCEIVMGHSEATRCLWVHTQ
jgi:hypothetical protein